MARDRKRPRQRRVPSRPDDPFLPSESGESLPAPSVEPDPNPELDVDGDAMTAATVAFGEEREPARRDAHSGNRVIGFVRASWAELQRVQWPDRRQVAQATAVVLGFVVVAGAYLGLADYVAQKVVNAIL